MVQLKAVKYNSAASQQQNNIIKFEIKSKKNNVN